MKLNTKQLLFIFNLCKPTYALQALDSFYNDNDEEGFKEHHHISFAQAEKYWEDFLIQLNLELLNRATKDKRRKS
jgi:hypothetical protein